jgi:hypothetical protein
MAAAVAGCAPAELPPDVSLDPGLLVNLTARCFHGYFASLTFRWAALPSRRRQLHWREPRHSRGNVSAIWKILNRIVGCFVERDASSKAACAELRGKPKWRSALLFPVATLLTPRIRKACFAELALSARRWWILSCMLGLIVAGCSTDDDPRSAVPDGGSPTVKPLPEPRDIEAAGARRLGNMAGADWLVTAQGST